MPPTEKQFQVTYQSLCRKEGLMRNWLAKVQAEWLAARQQRREKETA